MMRRASWCLINSWTV